MFVCVKGLRWFKGLGFFVEGLGFIKGLGFVYKGSGVQN